MANKFSSGKNSIAECDRCGQTYKLKQLKQITIKFNPTALYVCPTCWEPSHPQLMLGTFPVEDPQAVRNPRRDNSYTQSGNLANGLPGEGSRVYGWGWNPAGGGAGSLTPNALVATTAVGIVTILTT